MLSADLDVNKVGDFHYVGETSVTWNGRSIFGGQLIAQAMSAAQQSVDDGRHVHSLHGYFLRPGDPGKPVHYSVSQMRSGKSFSTFQVDAKQSKSNQDSQLIFSCVLSLQVVEVGLAHQFDMPTVAGPDSLESELDFWSRLDQEQLAAGKPSRLSQRLRQLQYFDLRPLVRRNKKDVHPMPPHNGYWIKMNETLDDNIDVHQRVLSYMSDFLFMETALQPHPLTSREWRRLQASSLDHAIWFYNDFRADEWVLYYVDSPCSSAARGLNRGTFYSHDGRLIASTVQEGLMRLPV